MQDHIKISRIIKNQQGERHFSITYKDEHDGAIHQPRYRTNSNGQGLWVEDRDGWKQILGTCQFRLDQSSHSNRAEVAWFAAKRDMIPGFEIWASDRGLRPNKTSAAEYISHLRAQGA